jgi:glycine hydroxymethyltransferase
MLQTQAALDAASLAGLAKDTVARQNEWRGKNTLNLIASENVMSPAAMNLYASDFEYRYAEGTIGDRYYEGTRYVDVIEDATEKAIKTLFRAEFVDLRPLSGAQANLAIFSAFAKPGDSALSLNVPSGGHISYRDFGAAGCRGLAVHDIPFNNEDFTVDIEALHGLFKRLGASLRVVTLGGSLFLFPHPVTDIAKALSESFPDGDVVLHYDAAHVLGLIAGGQFQDPLREGALVVSASTHKTFPGPQGGILLASNLKDKQRSSLRKAVFPGLVSNHHIHRIPALLYAAAEMMRFGQDYASQTVANAKSLARSLDELGFKVVGKARGYTSSHQVAFDASGLGGGALVSRALTEANIIVNKNLLPGEDVRNSKNPAGIRLGVQEVTRFGMKEREMDSIAHMFHDLLIVGESKESIATRATSLRREFEELKFTF